MSRLESGIIRLKPEQSSLNDIVMQAVKTVYAKVRDKNITITFGCGQTFEALESFTWGTRGKFFWDGNKRTSLLLANKILVSSGAGIMTITDKYMEQFNSLLLNYYNTGETGELKQFLYENAIQGIKI